MAAIILAFLVIEIALNDKINKSSHDTVQNYNGTRRGRSGAGAVGARWDECGEAATVFSIVQSVRPDPRTGLDCMDTVRPEAWTGRARPENVQTGRTAVDCSRLPRMLQIIGESAMD